MVKADRDHIVCTVTPHNAYESRDQTTNSRASHIINALLSQLTRRKPADRRQEVAITAFTRPVPDYGNACGRSGNLSDAIPPGCYPAIQGRVHCVLMKTTIGVKRGRSAYAGSSCQRRLAWPLESTNAAKERATTMARREFEKEQNVTS